MHSSAALGLDCLQSVERVETLARKHHRRAMRQAGEVAEHHAKTMIKRHRDAQPIVFAEPHRLADEETVVEDVVVGERGALWKARGATSELDVYRIVELQLFGEYREAAPLATACKTGDLVEPHHAMGVTAADGDHKPQLRQPRRAQVARR